MKLKAEELRLKEQLYSRDITERIGQISLHGVFNRNSPMVQGLQGSGLGNSTLFPYPEHQVRSGCPKRHEGMRCRGGCKLRHVLVAFVRLQRAVRGSAACRLWRRSSVCRAACTIAFHASRNSRGKPSVDVDSKKFPSKLRNSHWW
ncbi:hypothetical protein RB195_006907 [Necator americanus]|uniref:Uncharacterized protein n=1 Tax=Necator americanus TaxID=51031 RepID=A0ABR1BY41_NECAM